MIKKSRSNIPLEFVKPLLNCSGLMYKSRAVRNIYIQRCSSNVNVCAVLYKRGYKYCSTDSHTGSKQSVLVFGSVQFSYGSGEEAVLKSVCQ